ncbi:12724_t:CDS:2 [Rhizophagus irregularis]|nr:12724_t:CDS:2 [Rhizophagus irregularis]
MSCLLGDFGQDEKPPRGVTRDYTCLPTNCNRIEKIFCLSLMFQLKERESKDM